MPSDTTAATARSGTAALAVVGSVNRDLVLHTSTLPRAGETVLAHRRVVLHGGKGANQAVAGALTAPDGAAVALVAAVGDDRAGDDEITNLERSGVLTQWVHRSAGAATGTAHITVDAAGENQIVVLPGANALMSPQHVRQALTALRPAVVLISLEISDAAVDAAVRAARDLAATVILNPAPYRSFALELLDSVDVVTPNLVEALQLVGSMSGNLADAASVVGLVERHRREHRGQPTAFVVTAGRDGAYLCADGRAVLVPAPVVDVRDTVGAGDAFSGALAAYLVNGALDRDAVEFATLVAARAVTTPGAQLTPRNASGAADSRER